MIVGERGIRAARDRTRGDLRARIDRNPISRNGDDFVERKRRSIDKGDGVRENVDRLIIGGMRATEQQTLAHEREVALRVALQKLSRSYREAVVLRDIEGFSYEEIATTLGINVGTVKSRLARGRQELRQRLEGSL